MGSNLGRSGLLSWYLRLKELRSSKQELLYPLGMILLA